MDTKWLQQAYKQEGLLLTVFHIYSSKILVHSLCQSRLSTGDYTIVQGCIRTTLLAAAPNKLYLWVISVESTLYQRSGA